MPIQLGGKHLRFGGTIDADALQDKKFVFTTSDKHKLNWQNAFGLSFLDLSEVELNLEVEKGAFSISLDGMVSGPLAAHGKKREVTIDFAIEDKKITDFALSLPDSKLYLHSVHEFRSIPGAHKLAVEYPNLEHDLSQLTLELNILDIDITENKDKLVDITSEFNRLHKQALDWYRAKVEAKDKKTEEVLKFLE